ILVLIYVFGGIIAAIAPIISGVLSVNIVIAILYYLGYRFELSVFVLNVASMLGLGLTIDYTLLIINRFREELAQGHPVKKAIEITLTTAGKAVFFSGLTVLVSFSAMLFLKVNILFSMAIGGIIVVFVAVMSALVFLPA